MRIKVSKWEMDVDNKAILYIKDTDDNPRVHDLIRMIPIGDIECVNNDVETRKFYGCLAHESGPDKMDGDFLVHPFVVKYQTYE